MLIVAAGAWAWSTARHVRVLRSDLGTLGARTLAEPASVGDGLEALQRDLGLLRRDLALPLALAPHLGWLPRVGSTLQAAPQLMDAADGLLASAIGVWDALGATLGAALRDDAAATQAGAMLAASVSSHEVALRNAAVEAHAALDSLDAIDATRLMPRVAQPLLRVQQLAPLAGAAFDLLLLAPDLFDEQADTYLLLAQNSDELRATGGFISSIGQLVVGQGVPSLGAFVDSYLVETWDVAHPDPPVALRETMGIDLWTTRDGNWWPHFPTSAQAVIDLYALNQGTQARGVIALDIAAATRLVDALAPLTLEDGQRLLPGQVLDAYRASWSLPADALLAPPVTITATRALASADVTLVLNNRQGTAWIDDVRLERADAPSANLLANGSFEPTADSAIHPTDWRAHGLSAADGLDADRAAEGRYSLRLVGELGISKGLTQQLDLSAPAGTVLQLSASVATLGVDPDGGAFALQVVLHYTDGTRERYSANLPPYSHDWASAGTARALGQWYAHRKDFIDRVWQAAQAKVAANPQAVRWEDVLSASVGCLEERHIQLYAQDAALQALFGEYGWAGAVADVEHDYLLVVDSNVGYNKVSASIEQSMDYDVDLATGMATLEVRYRNTSVVAVKDCDKFRQYTPSYEALTQGCYWGYVRVYAPAGSRLVSAEGADSGVELFAEQGKTVLATSLMLAPGEERRLRLTYQLPASVWQSDAYALLWQKQAGTDALPISVTLGAGDKVEAAAGVSQFERTADGELAYRGTLRTDVSLETAAR